MFASFWVSLSAWRAAASALLFALVRASSLVLSSLTATANASATHGPTVWMLLCMLIKSQQSLVCACLVINSLRPMQEGQ